MGLSFLLEIFFLCCHCYLRPVVSSEVSTAKRTNIRLNACLLLPEYTIDINSGCLCTASSSEHLQLLILQLDFVLLANLFHTRVDEVVARHVLLSHLVKRLSDANVEVFREANGSN